jgi:hypothetical protein
MNSLAKKMISKVDYCNSQIIGDFIKIILKIDGPEFYIPSFSLRLTGDYIEIIAATLLPQFVFKKVCETLKDIAAARKLGNSLK